MYREGYKREMMLSLVKDIEDFRWDSVLNSLGFFFDVQGKRLLLSR